MPRFRYNALDTAGSRLSGEFDAASRQLANEHLVHLGLLAVDIDEVEAVRPSGIGAALAQLPGRTSTAVTQMTRQLAMLLAAGLTLDRALSIIERDAPADFIGDVVRRVRHCLAGGASFSESLAACGNTFPAAFVSMVRVGEATGELQAVLARIADAREREQKTRAKVVSALIYPCLLLVTAVGAVTGILVWVVPQFKDMIQGSGRPAPAAAAVIIAVSDWLIANGWLLLALVTCAITALVMAGRNDGLRSSLATASMRIPLYGQLARHRATVLMCRTLGVLLENGVDLALALKLTEDTLGRSLASTAVAGSREALRKGQSFVDVLSNAGLFPLNVISMLKVGEETGNLRDAANWAAQMSEDKLDSFIDRAIKLIEPCVVLVASVMVASIVISIMTAIISLNELAN